MTKLHILRDNSQSGNHYFVNVETTCGTPWSGQAASLQPFQLQGAAPDIRVYCTKPTFNGRFIISQLGPYLTANQIEFDIASGDPSFTFGINTVWQRV